MSYEELKERGIFLPDEHQGKEDLRRPPGSWAVAAVGLVAVASCVAMVLGGGRPLTWIGAGVFLAGQWGFTLLVNRSVEEQNRRVDRVKKDGS